MKKNVFKGLLILIITIALSLLLVFIVNADSDVYCKGSHILTCSIGATQDNITLVNMSNDQIIVNLTTGQNAIGIWNATYDFAGTGTYCARCNQNNQSECFEIVNHCQENIYTNITNIKNAVDDIQTDIGDPSSEGFSIWSALKQFLKNVIGVNVAA